MEHQVHHLTRENTQINSRKLSKTFDPNRLSESPASRCERTPPTEEFQKSVSITVKTSETQDAVTQHRKVQQSGIFEYAGKLYTLEISSLSEKDQQTTVTFKVGHANTRSLGVLLADAIRFLFGYQTSTEQAGKYFQNFSQNYIGWEVTDSHHLAANLCQLVTALQPKEDPRGLYRADL